MNIVYYGEYFGDFRPTAATSFDFVDVWGWFPTAFGDSAGGTGFVADFVAIGYSELSMQNPVTGVYAHFAGDGLDADTLAGTVTWMQIAYGIDREVMTLSGMAWSFGGLIAALEVWMDTGDRGAFDALLNAQPVSFSALPVAAFDGPGVDVSFDFMQAGIDMTGTEGPDTLEGGQGGDRIDAFGGPSLLIGNGGNDTITASAQDDTLLGGDGNDRLYGHDGDDSAEGGAGRDRLEGGAVADLLEGGGGNDLLSGGANADRFVFADGNGADTIADFEALNGGEKIDLSGVTAIVGLADLELASDTTGAAAQVGADVVIDTGGGNSITLAGVDLADLDAADFIF